jgi:replicative DNA helicase
LTLLTDEEVDRRVSALLHGEAIEADVVEPIEPTRPYRWVKPFANTADELIDICTSTEGRWLFGIKPLDDMLRGIGRGQLCYLTAKAHSGKTALVLTSMVNNPNARVLLFTPDEVAVEVLAKLVSMVRGIDGETLEQRIRKGDSAAIDAVYRTAQHDFRNLVVIDETLSFDQMECALREAEEMWGGPADMIAVDYLELLGDGDSDGIAGLSKDMKRWTKKVERPVICLRQNSRTSSKRGQAAGMEGMSYAGQNEAIYVLEVFRKGDDESMPEADRDLLRDSITVNIAKNKRPPCKRGMFDLHMDPATGVVRVPVAGDSTYRAPIQSAPKAAMAAFYALKED